MDCGTQDLRQAWMVLQATRLRLVKLKPRTDSSSTGFIPPVAMEELTRVGWDGKRAESAVCTAVIEHFPAFAASWDAYIDHHGWLIDLAVAPQRLQEQIAGRFHIEPLISIIEVLRTDPRAPLEDSQQWGALVRAAGGLALCREPGGHPAEVLMVRKYGINRELVKAVLLYSRSEPWWWQIVPAFLGGLLWQVKVRPKRQQRWREQLARYVQTCGEDQAR